MRKVIFKNLLRAIGVMCYFIVLNIAYTRMNLDRLVEDIKVFSGTFLVLGILALEKAYKEDSGKIAITGIELLVLSMHSLSIMHVITLYKYDFRLYLLVSSYVIAIYYVLKAIFNYTKERKEYLKSLSDISEIVKEDEPIKKEAKKRNTEGEEKTSKTPKTKTAKNRPVNKTKNKENKTGNKKTKKSSKTKKKIKKEVKEND
jgi:hypothetical protein